MDTLIGEDLDLATYLSRWLDHCHGRVRQKTWQSYEGLTRVHALPVLGEIRLGDLHPLHLQGLYADLLKSGLAGGLTGSPETGPPHVRLTRPERAGGESHEANEEHTGAGDPQAA